ncbi:hypothetical protein [Sphingomonas sp. RIT328]|uniref:hypothetical protein n=1 Tax=Sphingomonas sp. RIT328 TaxID=1470591 RepID=UPI00044B1249|nr:hypothetical protein [Sphingomonas sp. RIT328]EZP57447.1 hypothetical protein BW41_00292 [Sphingomonas sp. RIT328]
MAIDYECNECGGTSPDLDETVLHDLVVNIVRGNHADALIDINRLVRDHPNADALSERIAIARAAA